jgi:chromosome segregation ATPase
MSDEMCIPGRHRCERPELRAEIAALRKDAATLDEVVHALGIEDSHKTPQEAIHELVTEAERQAHGMMERNTENAALTDSAKRAHEDWYEKHLECEALTAQLAEAVHSRDMQREAFEAELRANSCLVTELAEARAALAVERDMAAARFDEGTRETMMRQIGFQLDDINKLKAELAEAKAALAKKTNDAKLLLAAIMHGVAHFSGLLSERVLVVRPAGSV